MPFLSDEPLWYNVGVWGELGYGVPNFGDNPSTLNDGIFYLVDVMGRNLSAVMHHPDVDLRTPPSINTLTRVHKLIVRARSILSGRAVAPGTPNMEASHSSPAEKVFRIYPVPFFKVRNAWLGQYSALVFAALTEAYQHMENRRPFEISTDFSGLIGQYLQRVYVLMATELFGIELATAKAPAFTLTDAQLSAYDPGKWFTRTEMIDVAPPVAMVPTEDDLRVLTDGIPATQLVGLAKYPSNLLVGDGVANGTTAKATTPSTGAFAAAPTA